jgi:hypothetical protein
MSSEFIGVLSILNYNGPKSVFFNSYINIQNKKRTPIWPLFHHTLIHIYEYTNIQLDHLLGVMRQFPVVYQMQSVGLT